jgi:hypothetical protein
VGPVSGGNAGEERRGGVRGGSSEPMDMVKGTRARAPHKRLRSDDFRDSRSGPV